jgi:L-threonylcarbamoyladenylate synthase
MSIVVVVDEQRPGVAAIDAAAAAIAEGRLVVFPTDTVYGIACRPDDDVATGRLFEAKQRPADLSLPVLVATTRGAFELGVPIGAARRLAAAFWPGALTIVLPRTERTTSWYLGEDAATVGLRVPGHEVAVELLRRTGPLAVTSANRSGAPPAGSPAELVRAFGESADVYLVQDEPLPPAQRPSSTVVDLTRGKPIVRRRGAITTADLDRVMAITGPEADSVH